MAGRVAVEYRAYQYDYTVVFISFSSNAWQMNYTGMI